MVGTLLGAAGALDNEDTGRGASWFTLILLLGSTLCDSVEDKDLEFVFSTLWLAEPGKKLCERLGEKLNDWEIGRLGDDGEKPGDTITLGEDGDKLGDEGDKLGDEGEMLGDDGEILGDEGEMLGDDGEMLGDDGDMLGDDGEMLGDDGDMLGEDGDMLGDDGETEGEMVTGMMRSREIY